MLDRSDLSEEKPYLELGKKQLNKLVQIICNDSYVVRGKTTFKEEFVTCGGINLESINVKTMESKHIKNLYFVGEILDIDGITGGFNFQSKTGLPLLLLKTKLMSEAKLTRINKFLSEIGYCSRRGKR